MGDTLATTGRGAQTAIGSSASRKLEDGMSLDLAMGIAVYSILVPIWSLFDTLSGLPSMIMSMLVVGVLCHPVIDACLGVSRARRRECRGQQLRVLALAGVDPGRARAELAAVRWRFTSDRLDRLTPPCIAHLEQQQIDEASRELAGAYDPWDPPRNRKLLDGGLTSMPSSIAGRMQRCS